jgi:phosphoglycolate phosphatase-like HAD superfamily hydrolase
VTSKKLLVCDLDNTLYDWVGYFVPSFYAMVDAVVQITHCDREKLLDDFRAVHQEHANVEHPFALLETDTIKSLYRGAPAKSVLHELDPAFHAFNSARKRNLHLHPHVIETLHALKASGIRLVAHTESNLYGVVDRLSRLNLFPYFTTVYCRERSLSAHPSPEIGFEWLKRVPLDNVVELSRHQAKPNPTVLMEICAREGHVTDETAYVGDSIARDILMANRAAVFSIWAEYGARHDAQLYAQLVRISHWTPEEVATELRLKEEAKAIRPDYIARNSFAEVLSALDIRRPYSRVS